MYLFKCGEPRTKFVMPLNDFKVTLTTSDENGFLNAQI